MLEMKHTHVVWKQMFCKFDHDNRLFILYYVCSTRFLHNFCDHVAGLLLLHVCSLYLTMLDVILFYSVVISF